MRGFWCLLTAFSFLWAPKTCGYNATRGLGFAYALCVWLTTEIGRYKLVGIAQEFQSDLDGVASCTVALE